MTNRSTISRSNYHIAVSGPDANGLVLASTLIRRIVRLELTFLDRDSLLFGSGESSFRDDLYFNISGFLFIRFFFFWICPILAGCSRFTAEQGANRLVLLVIADNIGAATSDGFMFFRILQ